MLDALRQDLRLAARSLRRTPSFTATAVLTLAIGIGATTAIFSLVNAVLLRPVPYPSPERLVVLSSRNGSSQSGRTFVYVRERARRMEAVAAQGSRELWNLVTPSAVLPVTGLRVSTAYLRVHGVAPLAGREFTADEDRANGPEAALVSQAVATRLFGSAAAAIGQALTLGNRSHAVVGVRPADFSSIPEADVLIPLRTTSQDTGVNYRVFGRLPSAAPDKAADQELAALQADLVRDAQLDARRVPPSVWAPYRQVLGRTLRQPVLILLAAVSLLLVIGSVNVAGLYVARSFAQHQEMATRAALGAPRRRLMGQVLAEAAVVALAAAIGGLAIAFGATRGFALLLSSSTLRDVSLADVTSLDWRVLLATSAMTAASALIFGLVPAWSASRTNLQGSLRARGRTGSGRVTPALRRAFTAVEVALAVVLLVGAGLLMRTFFNLTRVEPGFQADRVLVGRMSLQDAGAEGPILSNALFGPALERIRQVPGVVAAAVSNHVPVETGLNLTVQPPAGGVIDRPLAVDWRYVSPEYFEVFRIPTHLGRTITEDDRRAGRPVALVNEAFARTFFGRLDVLGQTIQLAPAFEDPPRAIVGVVGNVKARSNAGFSSGLNAAASDTAPAVFVPAAQASETAMRVAHRFFDMKWAVRANGPTGPLEQQVREAVRSVAPTLPFVRFEPMTAVVAQDLDLQRLLSVLLGAFAVAAILLAGVGLYGLIAYAAAQRTREVGIRMALGATAGRVVATLVREGVATAGVGLAAGIAGALFASRVLQSLLFGVSPVDASTFAAVGLAFAGVAAVAAFAPAIRAVRINPVEALRAE